jgi:predicted O-methyltransferase YrrM
MNAKLKSLLNALEASGQQNDSHETDRAKKLLNLEPETAQLVSLLARSSGATRVLEIGTSNGYSTLWLAWTVASIGGRVTSIDRNAQKQAMARQNLATAELLNFVDLHCGDATALVAELPGPFDFVFFDADRSSAPQQLRLLLPKLAPRAVILADNVLSNPQEIAGYLEAISTLRGFESMVVPVGKGLSIACRSTSE